MSAMPPLERVIHDIKQKRSFARGLSKMSTPTEQIDAALDKMPEYVLLKAYEELQARLLQSESRSAACVGALTTPSPDLDAIRERLEKATPGEWHVSWTREMLVLNEDGEPLCEALDVGGPAYERRDANATFIAHAPADIAALLAHIAAQERAWRPITETEPPEGAIVLCTDGKRRWMDVRIKNMTMDCYLDHRRHVATMWHPVAPLPEQEPAKDDGGRDG